MANIKDELVGMMNRALELEHAARIQYLTHAEQITGLESEQIIERLKEIASDEQKHEEKFRTLIGDYLGGEPTMQIGKTTRATETTEILTVNVKAEQEAIDFYKQIYKMATDHRNELPYEYETIEHELRHIIVDEQEHVVELTRLLER